jgi:hypothetical protein
VIPITATGPRPTDYLMAGMIHAIEERQEINMTTKKLMIALTAALIGLAAAGSSAFAHGKGSSFSANGGNGGNHDRGHNAGRGGNGGAILHAGKAHGGTHASANGGNGGNHDRGRNAGRGGNGGTIKF